MPRVLVALLVLGWLLLIGLFAEVSPLQSPWPQQRNAMPGASFAAMRGGQVDDDALLIDTPDENYGALLIRSVDLDDAAQWPLLRYEFEGWRRRWKSTWSTAVPIRPRMCARWC